METARKKLTLVGTIAKSLLPTSHGESEPIFTDCEICSDTGFEIVANLGARICVCRIRKIQANGLAKIPPKFAESSLLTLKPLAAKHPRQAETLAYMSANPTSSYFFAGSPGTGKSLFMWALYRHAVEVGKTRVVICTLSALLDEYKAFIRASMNNETPKYPRLGAEELRQSDTRYSIFLDDIDKANPTDYAAEQIFGLVNAIYEFRHQLVVTTNKTIGALITHYNRSDDRGEPIVRRMMDGAKIVEMF